ncbi:MAG: Spy/CpxP family protein refolding chaperone [Sulfuricellaceae bacterium]
MQTLKKRIALGLAVAALSGAVVIPAFAQRQGDSACSERRGGARFDSERFAQRMEKRQQALHDQLKLSASQEKAWRNYSEAMKSLLPKQEDFKRDDWRSLSAPERSERMLSRAQERVERMRKGNEAMKTFYAALSPEQKKIFDQEAFGGFHGKPGR